MSDLNEKAFTEVLPRCPGRQRAGVGRTSNLFKYGPPKDCSIPIGTDFGPEVQVLFVSWLLAAPAKPRPSNSAAPQEL